MTTALQTTVSRDFAIPPAGVGRFQIFATDASLDLAEVHYDNRLSVRTLSYASTNFLLAAVHVVDKRNYDPQNQQAEVQLLAHTIATVENAHNTQNTILIGDFNMNPFDPAMHIPLGLNARMTRTCVEKGGKYRGSQFIPFFYNPMWSLLGDRTPGPAGTYFHTTATSGMYGWNMLDQVLIRPMVIPYFHDVQILTTAGQTSLATKRGKPNRVQHSDHFPLLLTLK